MFLLSAATARTLRPRPFLSNEVAQAVVVLATGRAALEVRAHPGIALVRPPALQLELDVLVELLEALARRATRARPGRAAASASS